MKPDADFIRRVLEMAQAIQQVSAPTFDEGRRAAFILERFKAEGLLDCEIDPTGNVYARLPGAGRAAPLVVSAHLDTVFPIETNLALKHAPDQVFGPGIGDNSLGVAGLLALLWMLRPDGQRSRLPGDVWLVGNVGEEGLGNLNGMFAVVERFGAAPRAYIILEGMALGQVYHRGLGVRRYRIQAATAGGHSWVDYGRPSAIHALVGLAADLAALSIPEKPRTSLNVGTISGGTSVNTIAANAELLLDLRSEDQRTLLDICSRVERMVRAANRPGVQVIAELVGQRPAGELPAGHALVRHAARCLEAAGVQPNLNIGSTDANAPLSRGYPAVCVGLTSGGGAHTVSEYIHVPPLQRGLVVLLDLVEAVFRQ